MLSWRTDTNPAASSYPLADREVAPIGCWCPDVLLSPPNVRLPLKASGPWTPCIPECGRFIIDHKPAPLSSTSSTYPSHHYTPCTVIDWPLPFPLPHPLRSRPFSEPLRDVAFICEVIWVRAPLVFVLPRLWEKTLKKIVKVKVADHRKQFHLSVPRGPGRISAAQLSCSELPLPAKSELSKFEMKELLLGRRRDLKRGSLGCCVMTWVHRVNLWFRSQRVEFGW